MTIRTVGTLLALAVVLSGCTTDEKKPSVLPPAPSTSPMPSPTALASATLPLESTPETAQGASSFARYYMQVLGRAIQTVDATQLESLSDGGCGGCQNFIRAVKDSAAAGEMTNGGEFRVIFAEAPPVVNGEVIVDLRYERAAATVVDRTGAVRAEVPADPPLDTQVRLMRQRDGWIVLGFRATPAAG